MPAQFVYKDFNLAPGRTCNTDWIDPSFCEATQPKAWSTTELEAVTGFFAPLYSGKLDFFLNKVLGNGFNTIYRYGHSFRPVGGGKYAREEHGAWVDGGKLVGVGRMLSDGEMYSSIFDVVVDPENQGQGVGRLLMEALIEKAPNTCIHLTSTFGNEMFYYKLGFRKHRTAMALYPEEKKNSVYIDWEWKLSQKQHDRADTNEFGH
ncbi:MAG: GNAT family N-acetyltransferase [Deltaproteobacteria bacterium]|nr:GNAT family N-acetyltransferase [Deltaproteobacteria bacterium]